MVTRGQHGSLNRFQVHSDLLETCVKPVDLRMGPLNGYSGREFDVRCEQLPRTARSSADLPA